MKRVIVASLAVVLVSACGSSAKRSELSNTATTTASRKRGGTVTLLTHDAFAVSKPVRAEFTKETGYKIKLVQPGDAGVVVNQAILRKGDPVADALFGVDNTFLTRALDAGIFDPFTPAAADTIRAGVYTDPQHRVTPIDQGDVCLNDDLSWFGHNGHPAPPTSLDSLIEPAYKNLTVVENPATSSPGLAFMVATIEQYGVSGWVGYWKKLKANGVRVVDDWNSAYNSDFTAGGPTGDRPIVVSYGSSPPADIVYSTPHRDTSRVGVIASACFRQYEFVGVLKGAKNVAGAQALVDFMVSRTFQDDMPLAMYVNPVVAGARLPALYAKWVVVPAHPFVMDPVAIGRQRDAWIKTWTETVVQ